jgi:hypothetical protein
VIKERRLKKEIKKTKTLNRSNDEIKCECWEGYWPHKHQWQIRPFSTLQQAYNWLLDLLVDASTTKRQIRTKLQKITTKTKKNLQCLHKDL